MCTHSTMRSATVITTETTDWVCEGCFWGRDDQRCPRRPLVTAIYAEHILRDGHYFLQLSLQLVLGRHGDVWVPPATLANFWPLPSLSLQNSCSSIFLLLPLEWPLRSSFNTLRAFLSDVFYRDKTNGLPQKIAPVRRWSVGWTEMTRLVLYLPCYSERLSTGSHRRFCPHHRATTPSSRILPHLSSSRAI
jgi:hypothetical protein